MKKLMSPLFILAIAIATMASFAFKPATHKDTHTYFYTSDSPDLIDMQDTDNWEESGPSCSSNGNIPCSIVDFDGDKTDLKTYLDQFETPGALTNAVTDRRQVSR